MPQHLFDTTHHVPRLVFDFELFLAGLPKEGGISHALSCTLSLSGSTTDRHPGKRAAICLQAQAGVGSDIVHELAARVSRADAQELMTVPFVLWPNRVRSPQSRPRSL